MLLAQRSAPACIAAALVEPMQAKWCTPPAKMVSEIPGSSSSGRSRSAPDSGVASFIVILFTWLSLIGSLYVALLTWLSRCSFSRRRSFVAVSGTNRLPARPCSTRSGFKYSLQLVAGDSSQQPAHAVALLLTEEQCEAPIALRVHRIHQPHLGVEVQLAWVAHRAVELDQLISILARDDRHHPALLRRRGRRSHSARNGSCGRGGRTISR